MSGAGRKATSSILRKLSGSSEDDGLEGLESVSGPDLSDDRAHAALEHARQIAQNEWGAALDAELLKKLEKIYLDDGVRGLERLRDEGAAADLSDDELDGLEAIVETDGSRPTLQVAADGSVDPTEEVLKSWAPTVHEFRGQIKQVANSVGRIDLGTTHKGTGFVVKDNLVLTNRHVLQQIARHRNGEWRFRSNDPNITFDADPTKTRNRQFAIKSVIAAGPDRITTPLDYERLDFAILECEVPAGSEFPEPLTLEDDASKIKWTRQVYTVGYPAKPPEEAYEPSVLELLFRDVYGSKRFAPGEIEDELGEVATTVFGHDATTLAGNSGSCVVDLGANGKLVAGLHFAGFRKKVNYAHSVAKLEASLADLNLSWARLSG